MIEINGNPFPEYQGEALSWSIEVYDTINEQKAGYPRMRAVIRALKEHRPAYLEIEKRLLLRGSFDRMFGNVAKRQLSIIEEETA
jgi:hypothetical protein